MKLKLLIISILLSTSQLFAQVISLSGYVHDNNNQKIDYFSVELLSDTIPVLKGSFVDGRFSLNLPKSKEYILKISSLGYEDKYINILPNNIKDTLVYHLDEKIYSLDAVTVTASKPKLVMKNTDFILSVDKTYLSNEGSINNVIIKLPFVLLDANNKISIVGKNNVVVYIDNRKVLYNQELEAISPINVKSIQLINNPGARYDANADAVILIKTKQDNWEGSLFSLRTQETFGKCFSRDVNPNLNYNFKKMNMYLDYVYSNIKSKSEENTLTKNLINSNENNIYNKGYDKSSNNIYTIGLDYLLNKDNKITFQLLGWNNRLTPEVNIKNYYTKIDGNKSLIETEKDIKQNENHYDFSMNYESIFNNLHSLSSSFNYTLYNSDTNETIYEQHSSDYANHLYYYRNDNKAIYYQVNYNLTIESVGLNLTSGVKISHVSNESKSLFTEENNNSNNRFTYGYDFKELIPAWFIDVDKNFNKVNVHVGLRMEHTSFKGNYEKIPIIDTTYFDLFPTFGIDWSINKQSKLNINYSKKISRPSFRNLNPSIRYDNIFFYRQGNPHLLPTITDDASLSYTMRQVRMNVGYRHKKNATIFNYYQDDMNEDITVVKLDNHKSINFFYAGGFYQFKASPLTSSNSFTFTKPFAILNYKNETIKMEKPAFYFKTSNEFILSKHVSLFLDFIYNDLGETLLERKKRMYNLSAGVSSSFFDKRLSLNIIANDILDTYKFEDYRTYGFYDVIHEYMPDNTYVQINVRYNFSTGKQKFKVKNNNESTLRRL
jgi:hypothetical protein